MTPTARALRLVAATAGLQSVAGTALLATTRSLARALTALGQPGAVGARHTIAAVEALAWGGLVACSAWFGAAVLACARDLARHPARPVPAAARGCLRPAVVRSLLAALVGGVLVTPALRPVADPGPGHDPGWSLLEGLPLPGLPTGGLCPPVRRDTAGDRARPVTVRIRRGDSLWSMTAALIGPRAPVPRVAHAWPRLFHANRAVIGADPDLVLPGTTLRVPAGLGRVQHQHPAGEAR